MYYGIDIGGTKIAFAVFNEQGQEQARFVEPTPNITYEAFLSLLTEWITQADQRWQRHGQIGIGFPGIQDKHGRLLAPNIAVIHEQNVQQDLQQRLGRRIQADNDANCFLLSEYHGGSAAGYELALALTLGTGIGGALIHNGQLVNSLRGGSGEFGHGTINACLLARNPQLPLFRCGCGLQGCLETYVSGTGLARLYQYVLQTSLDTSVRLSGLNGDVLNVSEPTGPAIIRAWQQGNANACKAVSLYCDILAAGLGTLMTQLAPDVIVLGGGVSEEAWLYQELTNRIPAYLMRNVTPAAILPPVFGGSGGVRGAALLAKCAL
ncbi:ROK family protein [Oceanisphaera pacifica]|uniref:N-acetylglucosamine kinase n=1 Tax=Oceanisphaera pacifica TaxID=2818389 RepID=A0ABS3NJ84_9GAMM|nr:ROK family protein [Oceanisphaera pacifica]MBO1520661.1 ROK family protein [Oceanisphaera pacifica]